MCVQCFQEAIVRKVWLEEGICGEKGERSWDQIVT